MIRDCNHKVSNMIYGRWKNRTEEDIQDHIVNDFWKLVHLNRDSIIEVFKESKATEYYYYKMCFDMSNIDLKYKDEYLQFIFDELKDIFK